MARIAGMLAACRRPHRAADAGVCACMCGLQRANVRSEGCGLTCPAQICSGRAAGCSDRPLPDTLAGQVGQGHPDPTIAGQVGAFKDYTPGAAPAAAADPDEAAADEEAPEPSGQEGEDEEGGGGGGEGGGGGGGGDYPPHTVMGLPALSPTMSQGARVRCLTKRLLCRWQAVAAQVPVVPVAWLQPKFQPCEAGVRTQHSDYQGAKMSCERGLSPQCGPNVTFRMATGTCVQPLASGGKAGGAASRAPGCAAVHRFKVSAPEGYALARSQATLRPGRRRRATRWPPVTAWPRSRQRRAPARSHAQPAKRCRRTWT